MNIKTTIILFFVTTISVTTELTDFATIDFPEPIELIESNHETYFSATDENATYLVVLNKLTRQQGSRLSADQIPELYDGVVSWAIDAANGQLVSSKDFTINGILGREIEYLASTNPELPAQRFKRIIYSNQYIISIEFWPLTTDRSASNKCMNQFYDSFSIHLNPTKSEDTQEMKPNHNSSTYDVGYELGYLTGVVSLILILLGLLLGVIFLIRFLARKKKTKEQVIDQKKTIFKIEKIVCGKCDTENSSDSKYCSRCGYSLPTDL